VQFGFVQHTVITLPNHHGTQVNPVYINDLLPRRNCLIRVHKFTRVTFYSKNFNFSSGLNAVLSHMIEWFIASDFALNLERQIQ
jgi:hypothetical protein